MTKWLIIACLMCVGCAHELHNDDEVVGDIIFDKKGPCITYEDCK